MVIIKQILNSFLFWGGWIIIPFIMEIVPALGSVFLLIRRNLRHKKKRKEMKIYPEISLIIPVYNSADTLYGCINRLMTVLTLMIKSEYSLLIIKVRTTASPYMRTVRRSFLTFLCSGLMQSRASQEHLTCLV